MSCRHIIPEYLPGLGVKQREEHPGPLLQIWETSHMSGHPPGLRRQVRAGVTRRAWARHPLGIYCILKLPGQEVSILWRQPLRASGAFKFPQSERDTDESSRERSRECLRLSAPGWYLSLMTDTAETRQRHTTFPKAQPTLSAVPNLDPFSLESRGERKSSRRSLHYLQTLSPSIKRNE